MFLHTHTLQQQFVLPPDQFPGRRLSIRLGSTAHRAPTDTPEAAAPGARQSRGRGNALHSRRPLMLPSQPTLPFSTAVPIASPEK